MLVRQLQRCLVKMQFSHNWQLGINKQSKNVVKTTGYVFAEFFQSFKIFSGLVFRQNCFVTAILTVKTKAMKVGAIQLTIPMPLLLVTMRTVPYLTAFAPRTELSFPAESSRPTFPR